MNPISVVNIESLMGQIQTSSNAFATFRKSDI